MNIIFVRLECRISSIITKVSNTTLPRLFPESEPQFKLINPWGYIRGDMVDTDIY